MAPAAEGTVLVDVRGSVAWITLNRPDAMNALSRALVRDMRNALAQLGADSRVSVVVISGAGDQSFCAGADLKERRTMTLAETRICVAEINALMDEVAAFACPVIASLGGVAFGGGLELALACDLRIAREGVSMGLLEVRLGIIPGAGGTQRLARLCGIAAAKELILTGRRIDAVRAKEIGLLSSVVPASALAGETERWANDIAEAGPLAVAQAKRAIDEGWAKPLAGGLAVERECYEVVLTSEDRNEGLLAFSEKRKPSFSGK